MRIGLTFAKNDTGPAVRHGGYPALATVRVVPLRDRLRKDCDAEVTIDEDKWGGLTQAQQAALLDHEVSHLRLVLDRKTGEVRRDDLGRPRLKTVKADYNPGDMFTSVISRHGEDAIEFENIRRAHSFAQAALNGE